MARSSAETVRELEQIVIALQQQLEYTKQAIEESKQQLRERDRTDTEFRREMAELRQENAITKQRLEDHQKHVELWDTRWWGLLMLMAGALMSLASGLIVTLARK